MAEHEDAQPSHSWFDWLRWYDQVAGQFNEGDWARLLLWNARDLVPPDVLRRAVARIWIDVSAGLVSLPNVELPTHGGHTPDRLTPAEWRELFERTGYFSDENEDLGTHTCSKPTTLYRFAEHDRDPAKPGNEMGWSWTVSADDAAQFEESWNADGPRDGCVWKATDVDPGQMKAHLHTKSLPYEGYENEFVFEPTRTQLTHIRAVRNCAYDEHHATVTQ